MVNQIHRHYLKCFGSCLLYFNACAASQLVIFTRLQFRGECTPQLTIKLHIEAVIFAVKLSLSNF